MKRANVIRGRIEEHAEGLGTPTEQLVEQRAREIAVTNGRTAEQVTEADREQARLELEGAQNGPPLQDEEARAFVPRDMPPEVSPGQVARTRQPTDEQSLPDQLVEEGVEEAAHDRMVEGNRTSRRRDKRFEDQLPDNGE